MELQLLQMGYAVAGIAKTAREAINKVKHDAPDLILMDIKLGAGMDGIDAARIIQQQYRVPVIYMTAHADEDILSRALATNPLGYVNKPLREKDLRTTISLAFGHLNGARQDSSADTSRTDIWQFRIISDTQGRIKLLRPTVRDKIKKSGFGTIEELLPKNHLQNIKACLASGNSQLVTEKLGAHLLSFEYHPADTGDIVRINVTYSSIEKQAGRYHIQQTILQEALDHLATGIVLINENLHIFYTNKSADVLLGSDSDITNNNGYLNCRNPEYTSELQKIVLDGWDQTMSINRGPHAVPLHLLVSPLHIHKENYGLDLPTTILFAFESLNDTERVEDVLRSLYNLSPSEAKLAAQLVMTPNLEQVAETLGITHNTARTHLKHIYSKTQTNRLSTLLHLMVTGPVGVILHAKV